ncbi:hypothetical protein QL285_038088 [Trifolium repens]|nr:hypothetical protein QL285_038088 [Trifolium repens]
MIFFSNSIHPKNTTTHHHINHSGSHHPSPQQHFGFPSSQVEFGNYIDNDFIQRLVDDSDFSPNWFNSMAQVMDSSLSVQAQSSGQNLGFDLNTPVGEEEE